MSVVCTRVSRGRNGVDRGLYNYVTILLLRDLSDFIHFVIQLLLLAYYMVMTSSGVMHVDFFTSVGG